MYIIYVYIFIYYVYRLMYHWTPTLAYAPSKCFGIDFNLCLRKETGRNRDAPATRKGTEDGTDGRSAATSGREERRDERRDWRGRMAGHRHQPLAGFGAHGERRETTELFMMFNVQHSSTFFNMLNYIWLGWFSMTICVLFMRVESANQWWCG